MPVETVNQLVEDIRNLRLIDPGRLDELALELGRYSTPRALARELIERNWLTSYQANRIFQGFGNELLLGSYVLLERLGEGGMGVVFKARHLTLDRVVALKQIRKERLSSQTAVRRFYNEVKAAAQVSHPNIVMAYDADEVAGTHLFVMEYVDGIDLAKLLKRNGPLPIPQACDFTRQAALGLQHAHERGLVHRDIKPHNLLATQAGLKGTGIEDGTLKLLDLGLARQEQDTEGTLSSTMTEDGSVLGTPDYMAPEQAHESHSVDIRADLYSLGCTFYQLLTGRVPFPTGTLMQKLMKHKYEEPVAVEKLRPDVPEAVAGIVRKLMAKSPEERYQTPGELAQALEPYCSALTLMPPPKENSKEHLTSLLERSKLLMPHELEEVRKHLNSISQTSFDARRACKWLVVQRYLTEYQATLVLRGQVDHFFLNEYKILDRVGQGKMAGVYKAMHRLGQTVAIKALPPSKAKKPDVLARFQREARMALRVDHPNVVRTFQVGKYGPLHYIVMDYLDGQTLEELLEREGKLSPADAVPLIYQALLGLQHLHEKNIVHRDLKPANLMILPNETPTKPGVVKVVDIGLGRDLFGEDQSELTRAGALLGTPNYMAPEQAVDAHSADIRSDIYSLGCVLYHALAGQPPFTDKLVIRQIVRHASEAARPLGEVNSEVTDVLQEIVSCMMAKEPGQRYATPAAAAKALRVFLHSETVSVQMPQPAAPLRSYLTWLETNPIPEEATPDPADTATHLILDNDVMPLPIAEEPADAPAPSAAAEPAAPPPVSAPLVDEPVEPPYALPIAASADEVVTAPLAALYVAPVAQIVDSTLPPNKRQRILRVMGMVWRQSVTLAHASGRLAVTGVGWVRKRIRNGKSDQHPPAQS